MLENGAFGQLKVRDLVVALRQAQIEERTIRPLSIGKWRTRARDLELDGELFDPRLEVGAKLFDSREGKQPDLVGGVLQRHLQDPNLLVRGKVLDLQDRLEA